jgi:hypothetical protein
MKTFVAVAVAALLVGCAVVKRLEQIHPARTDAPVTLGEGDAAVLVGIAMAHDASVAPARQLANLTWFPYDRDSGRESDGTQFGWTEDCDKRSRVCDGGTEYRLFVIPAGSYAFGHLEFGDKAVSAAHYPRVNRHFRNGQFSGFSFAGTPALMPSTPRFTVKAGEVLYLGDLLFHLRESDKTTLGTRRDDRRARAVLAPTGLAERMVFRPVRDGGAVPQDLMMPSVY